MIKKILILAFSIILLSGCGKKSDFERISFTSWGSVSEVEILKTIIKDFETQNPNIKIDFIHTPQNYFQKLHLLFASNTAPDVIFINNQYLPIYEKHLEDLNHLINKQDFYSQAIDGLSHNGQLLAIPRDISHLVFYVNRNLVKVPNQDWTLDELIQQGKNIRHNDIFGISFEDDLYWALPYLSYLGTTKINPNLNDNDLKNLKFYTDLRDLNNIAPKKSQIGSSTLAQMFLQERIGFYLSGRWMYPKISKDANFEWAVINFPYGKEPQPCDVSGWAITKKSKHKPAAYKFVQYLSSEQNYKYFAQTGLIVPAHIKASMLLNKEDHNEHIFLDVIPKSKTMITEKDFKKNVDMINNKYIKE